MKLGTRFGSALSWAVLRGLLGADPSENMGLSCKLQSGQGRQRASEAGAIASNTHLHVKFHSQGLFQ